MYIFGFERKIIKHFWEEFLRKSKLIRATYSLVGGPGRGRVGVTAQDSSRSRGVDQGDVLQGRCPAGVSSGGPGDRTLQGVGSHDTIAACVSDGLAREGGSIRGRRGSRTDKDLGDLFRAGNATYGCTDVILETQVYYLVRPMPAGVTNDLDPSSRIGLTDLDSAEALKFQSISHICSSGYLNIKKEIKTTTS